MIKADRWEIVHTLSIEFKCEKCNTLHKLNYILKPVTNTDVCIFEYQCELCAHLNTITE